MRYRCEARIARVRELNRLIDGGGTDGAAAAKQKRGMRDVWIKRGGSDVRGFHKPNMKGPRYA